MRAVYFILLLIFPCAALAAEPTVPAFKNMSNLPGCNPAGFGNLIATCCWLYGGAYLLVAAVKAYRLRQFRAQQPQAAPAPTGLWFFVIPGFLIVAYPFLKSWSDSMQHPPAKFTPMPDGSMLIQPWEKVSMLWFDAPLMLLTVAAVFIPWLLLIFRKDLRHLRRQGLTGLAIAVLVPCAFFAVFAAFMIAYG